MTDVDREELVRQILDELGKRKTRMTYSAVACLLGVHPQGVGDWLGCPRPEASWVVGKRDGKPTGYQSHECHRELYCEPHVITSCYVLRDSLCQAVPCKHRHGCEGQGTATLQMVPSSPAERGRLVGTLVRMDSAKRSVVLEHRDGRTLKGTYAAESEAALSGHLRELVQVRGNICYDAAGEPILIGQIDEVAELDESPMEIEEIGDGHRANTPLRFDVAFDREDLFYELQGPFGILLSADSREDLKVALEHELRLLFTDYAEGNPEHMSSDAKKLREQIRGRFGL